MKYKYPVYRPTLSGNEKRYVNDCLDSTWISSKGKFVEEFENKFSDYLGIKYSATVSNGTVAIHVALLALGIGPGDEVIVPSFTYIASVNAIYYTGAKPVFVDSKYDSWQMDPEDVIEKISTKTKAILAVHLYGHPCDMDKLVNICSDHNLFLVEDTAESFGSKYKEKYAGGFGDISTFSFFGNKTITTGEGGMVSTNDEKLYKKVVHLKGQGLAQGKEYYHDIIGYNYRMTNICAAIGCAQLERADEIISKKRQIAVWYKEYLAGLPLEFHQEGENIFNTFWIVTIMVSEANLRDDLRKYLNSKGIETRPGFYPVHKMPMYRKPEQHFPVAESLGARGINLPSYPELEMNDVKYISGHIRNYFENV
jgi:perosamine synthetase